ncbi:MAG TPA: cob(I)yrinic acid a,c-diamide adenosyltransferase [Cytophagaceae bacterium]|jgi:cob(I)alamin adenosyltransferase
MKIYTKTGDAGDTSLYGGKRVRKSDLRIDAYGTVDELNSYIGLLRDYTINDPYKEDLIKIQDRLFTIGAILAADPDKKGLKLPPLHASDVLLLEESIDRMDATLEPMKFFILPGGHKEVSFCHIARCVCRRAERIVIALEESEAVNPLVIIYLNRLSDYLFVLSRTMGKVVGATELPWIPEKS